MSVELFPAIFLESCRDVQQVYNKLDGFTNVEWVLKYRSIFQSRMHHAVIGLLFCGDMLFGFNLTSLIPSLSLKQLAQRNASSSSGLVVKGRATIAA